MSIRSSFGDWGLWCGIRVLEGVLWVAEWFASSERREKMRHSRLQWRAVHRMADEMVRSGGRKNSDELFAVLENLFTADEDDRQLARLREYRQAIRASQEESEALCAIREQSGGVLQTEVDGYRAYLVTHPESHTAQHFLAGALERSGEFEESIELRRSTVQRATSEVEQRTSRVALGRGLGLAGRPADGIAELEAFIQSGPEPGTLSGAYFALGDLEEQIGDQAAARAAWRQAVRLDRTGVFRKDLRERGKRF